VRLSALPPRNSPLDIDAPNRSLGSLGLDALYRQPLAATRSGALYNSFSYPTKISPESIALFIAAHTEPGSVVLDPFGGSGTTAVAALLCSNPPPSLRRAADELGINAHWGPRSTVIYELSPLGAFVTDTLTHPPEPDLFLRECNDWLATAEEEIGSIYFAKDDAGRSGSLRHAIWTEFLECPNCHNQASLWDLAVRLSPVTISSDVTCQKCGGVFSASDADRVVEELWDPVLGRQVSQRKRMIARIYGRSGRRTWSREPVAEDHKLASSAVELITAEKVPSAEIPWGDLYRAGYHYGLTHSHQLYTTRNLAVMSFLWNSIDDRPIEVRDALRLVALSYNMTHASLLARVVVKHGLSDFALTGAQSGVLYVSGLPVEKNIFLGLTRKAKTLVRAFTTTFSCSGIVRVKNASSTQLDVPSNSVDYVFTDPPFGDFIPYAEINFLNEVWLGRLTDRLKEVVISPSQRKEADDYCGLLTSVFNEVSRVMKAGAAATVVFHAAKSEVWDAFARAYRAAGLKVVRASVLDKTQGSFKQVTSKGSVRSDPLLLLWKEDGAPIRVDRVLPWSELVSILVEGNPSLLTQGEVALKRLFSQFAGYYLEHASNVPLDAPDFYAAVHTAFEQERS
jgi:hypothetical protein